MQYVTDLLFETLPLELYLGGSILMAIGVIPIVYQAFVREKEYRPVALLMLVLSITQCVTSISALLFLYCSLLGCGYNEQPARGAIRLMLALNIFCSSCGFFVLYHMDQIKHKFHTGK